MTVRRKTEPAKAPETWELPFPFGLLPTQDAFVCDLIHPCQQYGGGVANGKTTGGLKKCFYLSQMFPGSVGMIARWEGKELRQTTIAAFRNMIPSQFIHRWNDQNGTIEFKKKYGGTTIYYRDLKDTDINNYDLTWAYVDQSEEIDDERWDALMRRTRRKTPLLGDNGPLLHPKTKEPLYVPNFNFGTFNPEGTSSYIWRFFHPDSHEKREGYQLYEATTFDGRNAGFVTDDYVDKLLQAYHSNPQARQRYLEGCWDIFSGRIYTAFAVETHVVPQITVQPHWKIYETIDHGLTNPTAVGWWAVDEADNWYLLDEHYAGDGRPVQYHALVIKNKRERFAKQWSGLTYLDSACWAANQSQGGHVYSIADEYAKYGIHAIPGAKDWDTSFSRITAHLEVDPNHLHPLTGEMGAPRLYVLNTCRQFIREMLGYQWKKQRGGSSMRNAPDEPIDYNDHHMDALAYLAASIHRLPDSPVTGPTITDLEKLHAMRRAYNPLHDTGRKRKGSWMSY